MKLCESCGACFDDGYDLCGFDGGALSSLFPGRRVIGGRYLLEQRLAAGAMGVVFRAAHLQVGSTVAVKLMQPQKDMHRVALQRFRREAQILGQIKHPNAVLVIDFGVDEKDGAELPYLVMEFLRGEPLDDVLRRKRRFPLQEVDRLLTPLCEAVEEAHQVGVIHRDIKPSNVFVERLRDGSEIVKVLDFGIAKFLELQRGGPAHRLASPGPISFPDEAPLVEDGDPDEHDPLDDNDFLDEVFTVRSDATTRPALLGRTRVEARGRLDAREGTPARQRSPTTEAGFMIGTIPYMAPEQMTGDSISRRTDVHAVAVLTFQLLAGRLPYDGDDEDIIQAKLSGERPSLREIGVEVPADVDAVLQRAFALDPAERPASVLDVARAVREAAGAGARAAHGARPRDAAVALAVEMNAAAKAFEAVESAVRAWLESLDDEERYAKARDLLLAAEAPLSRARLAGEGLRGPLPGEHALLLEAAHSELETCIVDLQKSLALLVERAGPAAEYADYAAALWSRLQGGAQRLVDGTARLIETISSRDDPGSQAPALFADLASARDGVIVEKVDRVLGRDPLDGIDALEEMLETHLDAVVAALSATDPEGRDFAGRLVQALWRHADFLLLKEMLPSTSTRRSFRLSPLLASSKHVPAAEPFALLARLLSTRSDPARAVEEVRAALEDPARHEPRGVLERCLLLHPFDEVRALVAGRMELSDFWNVIAHPGTPLSVQGFLFERVRQRAPPEYLKIFFFCVADHLRGAAHPSEIEAGFRLLKQLFAVPCFHEDIVFEPLLEVERQLRQRAVAVGAAPPEEGSYTESLAAFVAAGARDASPLEHMLDVPLPIQRKLAREGLFLSYFVSHAVEKVARETLPHLFRMDDVTKFLRIPTIHRAVLLEISKRKRFFRKDAPKLALLQNPKTPALLARPFLPLVSEDQLRLLSVNKHINPDVRRLIKTYISRDKGG